MTRRAFTRDQLRVAGAHADAEQPPGQRSLPLARQRVDRGRGDRAAAAPPVHDELLEVGLRPARPWTRRRPRTRPARRSPPPAAARPRSTSSSRRNSAVGALPTTATRAREPVAPELERRGRARRAQPLRQRGDARLAERADDVVVGGQARARDARRPPSPCRTGSARRPAARRWRRARSRPTRPRRRRGRPSRRRGSSARPRGRARGRARPGRPRRGSWRTSWR